MNYTYLQGNAIIFISLPAPFATALFTSLCHCTHHLFLFKIYIHFSLSVCSHFVSLLTPTFYHAFPSYSASALNIHLWVAYILLLIIFDCKDHSIDNQPGTMRFRSILWNFLHRPICCDQPGVMTFQSTRTLRCIIGWTPIVPSLYQSSIPSGIINRV